MARPQQPWPPQPREDPRGRMRVWWRGRWHVLGPADRPEAWRAELARLVALWAVDPTATGRRPDAYRVSQLLREYLESDAAPTERRQRDRAKTAARLLLESHLETAVDDFGPNDLRAWQAWLCRLTYPVPYKKAGQLRFNVTYIHDLVEVVRRVWKWAVSTERVDEPAYRALLTVERPKPGSCRGVREIPPADPAHVTATLPFLTPPIRVMVVLQMACGARPEELCGMKAGDVQRSGRVHITGAGVQDLDRERVWVYVLKKHKTTWKGKPRWLTFAADSQRALEPLLDRPPDAHVFDPREATGGKASRRVGTRYTPRTYRQAVERAAKRAGVPHWFPYQLRHLAAADVKALFDLDAVQALLGQHTKTMADHYGGVAFKKAAEVARRRAEAG